MLIKNKFEIIRKHIKGKEVLDCGCVGSAISGIHSSMFLHQRIAHHAKSVLGVDVNRIGLTELTSLGYNVAYGNVETMNLDKKFDVVIAGDIIEHVMNAGLFLWNVKRHLKLKGVLIIHTPNPFGITRFYSMLIRKNVSVNSSHVCYYDLNTLKQALAQHGFTIIESYYVNGLSPPFLKKLVIDLFVALSEGFADSILVVARVINK